MAAVDAQLSGSALAVAAPPSPELRFKLARLRLLQHVHSGSLAAAHAVLQQELGSLAAEHTSLQWMLAVCAPSFVQVAVGAGPRGVLQWQAHSVPGHHGRRPLRCAPCPVPGTRRRSCTWLLGLHGPGTASFACTKTQRSLHVCCRRACPC